MDRNIGAFMTPRKERGDTGSATIVNMILTIKGLDEITLLEMGTHMRRV